MTFARATALVFGLATTLGASWRAAADVTVERVATVVERRTFDPAHRPTTMPALRPGEAAVTESRFDCAADLTYKRVERHTDDSGCTVAVRVQDVRVTLTLKVTLWLPAGAPAKLLAHEEGHRQIDERLYDEAAALAKAGAAALEGQTLRASAADCTSAEQHATQSAADNVCRNYLAEIGRRAARVNDAYDTLTAHGTRTEPSEDAAVREALRCGLTQ